MKGVILGINPSATLVDISHEVPPQDIWQGAWMLGEVFGCFPLGTIHLAVVDPGVGTSRAVLCLEVSGQQLVLPDNGLATRVVSLRRPDELKIISVSNPAFWREPVSATFHGRDILAPVAAHLSLGLDPDSLGPRQGTLVRLDWPQPVPGERQIMGSIVSIDSFGNLISNITSEMLANVPPDGRVSVRCADHEARGIARTYADGRAGELMALVGSNGHLELAIVGGNAARQLAVARHASIVVTW
jgi:S-adenosylmethionine hydrolase